MEIDYLLENNEDVYSLCSYLDDLNIKQARIEHPDAKIVVHPECNDDVRQLADYVESTGGMIRLGKDENIQELIVGTEIDLATRLKRENPDKEFYPLRKDAFCLPACRPAGKHHSGSSIFRILPM